jgi:hypothetical protein
MGPERSRRGACNNGAAGINVGPTDGGGSTLLDAEGGGSTRKEEGSAVRERERGGRGAGG